MVPNGGGLQTLTQTFTLGSNSLQAVRVRYRYQDSAVTLGAGGTWPCNPNQWDDIDDLVFAVSNTPTAPPTEIDVPAATNPPSVSTTTSSTTTSPSKEVSQIVVFICCAVYSLSIS